jgi:hypothetical protein
VVLLMCMLGAAPAQAQRIEVSAGAVAVTNSEVDSTRQARGPGLGVAARMDRGRWRFEAQGVTASLDADFTVQPNYAVHQLAASASYFWEPGIRAVGGIERRFVSPESAGQEVGLVRLGLGAETRLSSLAGIEARADWLPVAWFSGGGGGGFSLGLGLGLRVGSATGRVHGLLEYSYERIDRQVNGMPSPIRFSVTRLGLGTRL